MALKPVSGKVSEWEGLWYHADSHCYTSASFNLSEIKQFKGNIRFRVVKNRFFNGGENGRPNYAFRIESVDSEDAETIDFNDTQMERLREIMREGHSNAYQAMLPSQSASRAERLMSEAIEIIEEMTGEKWDFSYITY